MQGWLCKSYRIELVAMRSTQVVQDEICENIMAHGAKIAQCIHYLPLHGGVTCCLQKHSWLRAWGPFTMNGDYIYNIHIYIIPNICDCICLPLGLLLQALNW